MTQNSPNSDSSISDSQTSDHNASNTAAETNSSNDNPPNSMLSNALGSACAGIVSRIFTHPIDTAKARLQAPISSSLQSQINYKNTWDVLTKTFAAEGLQGLYRGFGAILIGGTPGTVTYLCTYEVAKKQLSQLQQQIFASSAGSTDTENRENFVIHFCSGMIAETIACIIYVPVDVIKERLQVQHSAAAGSASSNINSQQLNYKGSRDALQQILKHEGVAGIYKGYAATLASFGPFSALYFMFYEQAKHRARQHLQLPSHADLPFPYLLTTSCSAGALASFLTSPLDMAKLRLQVQRGQQSTSPMILVKENGMGRTIQYRGVLDCLQSAYQQGGLRGLFRGAGARVAFFAPATTITMSCYETCRSFIARKF